MKDVSTTAAASPLVMGKGRFRNLIATALTIFAFIAGLSACTNPTSNQDVVPLPEPETSAPATGNTEIPPDEPDGNSKPSVSLPQLPVGGDGSFVDDEENLQCANVSWIVEEGGPAELRDGIRIVITGFRLDVKAFRIARTGCEDQGPTCIGYTFTSDSGDPACSLAVWTRRPLSVAPANPQLEIAGTIQCVDVEISTCQAFVEAAQEGEGSVTLSTPFEDEPDTTPSENETDQPGDDASTPTGDQSASHSEPTEGETTSNFIWLSG